MAYLPIEQAYIDGIVSAQFPDPEPQPEPIQLADSGQVKSDAGAGFGTIGPIKRNKAQEALGYVGELLTKAGVELDKVGLDVPVLGRISLKDLTVGDSGKVLEDMADGFYPVEGGGNFISGTKRIKPDAALELMNIAPAVGAAVKLGGKAAVKGVTKAVEATKGMPVGLSVKEVGQGVDDLGFYSAAAKAVDAIQQPKGTGDQFLKQIEKTPGVKADELKWTGLDDFLKSKKTVTKAEVQDYLNQNRVEIKEVQLGDTYTPVPKNIASSDVSVSGGGDEMWTVTNPDGDSFQIGSRVVSTPEEAADYGARVFNDNAMDDYTAAITSNEGKPKFSKYTLPGGENYREIYLTLQPKNPEFREVDLGRLNELSNKTRSAAEDVEYKKLASQYDASLRGETTANYIVPRAHSAGTNEADYNRLAHLRVNDRIDADGKKVLFVEEVQSDWHQQGRKGGYKGEKPTVAEENEYEALTYEGKKNLDPDQVKRLEELSAKFSAYENSVPDAPFKTTWHELAMKRAIQLATEGGYDRIAFTTGKTQAARYDLSKQIDNIQFNPTTNALFAEDKFGKIIIDETVNPNELDEYVGKEVAQKLLSEDSIISRKKDGTPYLHELSGVDLQVGGEGMAGFYDNIVPKFLDKYSKKWDAKTGMTEIKAGNESVPVHYFDVTPKMRESVVTKGQPLFAVGAGAGAGAAATKEENK